MGAVILVSIAATVVVLAFFAVDTLRNAPQTFAAIVVIAVLAVVIDFVWKRARGPLGDAPPEAVVES
jgi:magnesium-transporting ATPase (P-type)